MENYNTQQEYPEEYRVALIQSMCAPLMNKVKFIMLNAKKNIVLSKN